MGSNPTEKIINELESVLGSFSQSEIEELTPFLNYTEWPMNQPILKEGERADFIGFLVKGKLALKKETNFPEKSILLAILEKGATICECSMSDQHVLSSATITPLEESHILTLTFDRFKDLGQANPSLAIKLLQRSLSMLNDKYANAINRLATIL